MSRKRKQKRSSPACGNSGYASVWMCAGSTYDSLCVSGYTRLADNPEVQMAVGHIARLVGSMTIYLMRNTKDGDVRVKNELSKKVDVNPYRLTTRQNWMQGIVKNMLIEGNQIVYPQTSGGYLEDLIPLSPSAVSIQNRLAFHRLEQRQDILSFCKGKRIVHLDGNQPQVTDDLLLQMVCGLR